MFNNVLFYERIECNMQVYEVLVHVGPQPGPRHGLDPQLREEVFTQTLDHFNFHSFGNGTFNQRYLISGKPGLLGPRGPRPDLR